MHCISFGTPFNKNGGNKIMAHTYEYYCNKMGFDPMKDDNKLPPLENPDAIDDRLSPLQRALAILDYEEVTEFEKLLKEEMRKKNGYNYTLEEREEECYEK